MADEPTTKRSKDKKAKKASGAQTQGHPSTALVASSDPGAPATDHLEQAVGTITANQLTVGELTLSYPARDIVLVLDGLTASRVIAAFADPSRRSSLQDPLDTATSSMRNLWASFDLDRLLAVSWIPQLPTRAMSRMTVDPPNPLTDAVPAGPTEADAG